MKRFWLLLSQCVLICAVPAAARQGTQQVTPPSVEVRKVAEGVYSVQPPAAMRFDESNATVIIGEDGVLVVDTQTAPSSARAVIAEIRKLTNKPVRWVVNTHWHGDHVQGNVTYRDEFPGVRFIAQVNTREDIEKRAIPALKKDADDIAAWLERAKKALETGESGGQKLTEVQIEQVRGRVERRTAGLAKMREVTEFVLPEQTFDESLTLRPGREVRLLHFAGHTRGDAVLFLPAEKVLVSGDLLDDLPYTGHGSPRALVETLREFEKLSFETLIPGHGRVRQGAEAREHLRKVSELFDSIVQQTEAAAREGLDVDRTKKKVDVSALRSYFVTDEVAGRYWDFFVGEAVARAHQEATEPIKP